MNQGAGGRKMTNITRILILMTASVCFFHILFNGWVKSYPARIVFYVAILMCYCLIYFDGRNYDAYEIRVKNAERRARGGK